MAKAQLVKQGVKAENIHHVPIDTLINPQYFSHYGSTHYNQPIGRMATVVMLKPI